MATVTTTTADGDVGVLTYAALDPAAIEASVRSAKAGAVVSFVGYTRDEFQGKRVTHLDYESYTPLALKTLHSILLEARTLPSPAPTAHHCFDHSHPAPTLATSATAPPPPIEITQMTVYHLLGPSPPLTPSLVICVATPHRKEAFVVCEWLLERVKERVQVWKREWYDDGTKFEGKDGEGVEGMPWASSSSFETARLVRSTSPPTSPLNGVQRCIGIHKGPILDFIIAHHMSTRAIHLGNEIDPHTGAVVQPLTLSTTFAQKALGVPNARDSNPNRATLERTLASIEFGSSSYAWASGTAAMQAIVQTIGHGAHVVAIKGIYAGTQEYLDIIGKEVQNLSTTYVPFATATEAEIYAAIQPNTKLIFMETPTNPLISLASLPMVSRIARSHPSNPLVVVDNTFASPYYINPLLHGADVVHHSSTKYIGGHSDIVGGCLIVRHGLPELERKLAFAQIATGAVQGAFDAFLLTRSIKTLSIRCLQHGLSALQIAAYLERHPLVENVLYPGLKTSEDHERAKEVLAKGVWRDLEKRKGWEQDGIPFGGVLSFRVKGGAEQAERFIKSCKLIILAESLGGVESLAEVPSKMTHHRIPEADRLAIGITDNLIRVSIGLEDVDDLIADIDQALALACQI
ncbi:hypothetical protein RQP46_011393 [Phenoliferia psychrophenolica]